MKDKTTFLFPVTTNAADITALMRPRLDAVYIGSEPVSSLTDLNDQLNALCSKWRSSSVSCAGRPVGRPDAVGGRRPAMLTTANKAELPAAAWIHPPPTVASMTTYKVGYFVGSLSSTSINRVLSRALIRLAPDDLEFTEIPIGNLPLYSPDYDSDFPPEATALKARSRRPTPSCSSPRSTTARSPARSKNAIDWASRPWGENSFDHIPAAVIGASIGQIGTAMGQQSLRGVLSFCNARQMTSPEAYIQYSPEVFLDDGEVTNDSTREFLSAYMAEFRTYIGMVLTVLPRHGEAEHHAALHVLGDVAVRHPQAGVGDVEQDVDGLAGADQHGVLPHQVGLGHAVAGEHQEPAGAVQVERVVHRDGRSPSR